MMSRLQPGVGRRTRLATAVGLNPALEDGPARPACFPGRRFAVGWDRSLSRTAAEPELVFVGRAEELLAIVAANGDTG